MLTWEHLGIPQKAVDKAAMGSEVWASLLRLLASQLTLDRWKKKMDGWIDGWMAGWRDGLF